MAQEYDGVVVQVLESDTAERLRFILHCDVGAILVCICDRPLAPSDISSIPTLDSELSQLRNDVIGTRKVHCARKSVSFRVLASPPHQLNRVGIRDS